MKKLSVLFAFLIITSFTLANGVTICNASAPVYLKLKSSVVTVNVESQVAIVKLHQVFVNNLIADTVCKYAFPVNDKQSPTKLRWRVQGIWREALFSPQPQDTTLPGGGGQVYPALKTYLGNTAVYFSIPQRIMKDSTLEVEFTYVEFLPYSYGNVDFVFKNNYQLIQTSPLDIQKLEFTLRSPRHIDSLFFLSHSGGTINNYGDSASVSFEINEQPANADYKIRYQLSLSQLGLYGMSTFLSDSISFHDTTNGGYFMFVAEPDPGTEVINKVFTLIVDRSGSMSGNKIVQARNAASFIVNNLNTGDMFNIVDFSDNVSSFRPQHVIYDATNKQAALTYINTFQASGLTNISGAFSTAVPQFNATDSTIANIIIFFTDGQPTTGITSTTPLLTHIHDLIIASERTINVFTFGIGTDVNVQLLSLMASQNNGLSEFLRDEELEAKITEFYLKIKNPVMLNISMSFTPNIIDDTYPSPLPNLYKGQQLLVSGRYTENANVTVHFSGKRYGQSVNYNFPMTLADTSYENYLFLTKVWAKSKIEYLTNYYYTLTPGSPAANAVKAQIISLSMRYGVLSIFTSFNITVDVELVSLTAIKTSTGVLLEWRTGTEVNNKGFYIERRYGMKDWHSIGYVPGNGNSSMIMIYQFKDDLKDIHYRGQVAYRLKQIDFDGSVTYPREIEVFINTLPDQYSLDQNYPNPFNPITTIHYSLPEKGHVTLKVYDAIGNLITTLVNEVNEPGTHEVIFNGAGLSSGVYFYRMESGGFNQVKKFLLLK